MDAVSDVVRRLLDIGTDHIGIADTIGVGTAGRVKQVMESAMKLPLAELSGHFHDTYGQALTNIYACLSWAFTPLTPAWPAWVAAPTPRAPPATWPLKTWSTCCTAWAFKQALIWISWSMRAPSSRKCWAASLPSRVANAILSKRPPFIIHKQQTIPSLSRMTRTHQQHARLNYQLGDDVDALREAVRSFVDKELAPRAADIDRENFFPCRHVEEAGRPGPVWPDRVGRIRRHQHGLWPTWWPWRKSAVAAPRWV